MTDIHFYHLTHQTLEQALPQLLEKILDHGMRAVVMASSEERVEALAQQLWTYRPESFLPHGTKVDGMADHQPIWLTATEERPNGAHVLVLTDGASVEDFSPYTRVSQLFDGTNEAALTEARRRWKKYKTEGHTLTYWQQGEKGWSQPSDV